MYTLYRAIHITMYMTSPKLDSSVIQLAIKSKTSILKSTHMDNIYCSTVVDDGTEYYIVDGLSWARSHVAWQKIIYV